MTDHQGVAKARRYLEDYEEGDPEKLAEYFTDDVVWRVGGNHPLSGEYRGKAELLDYFAQVRDQTSGTLKLESKSVLASDNHTAMFVRVTGERDGRQLDVTLAQVLANGPDGRWNEYWALADNQAAVDEFWS